MEDICESGQRKLATEHRFLRGNWIKVGAYGVGASLPLPGLSPSESRVSLLACDDPDSQTRHHY